MDEFDRLYKLGIKSHHDGDHQEAIISFESALELQPTHAKTLYNLANVYSDLEDLATALSYYEESIAVDDSIPAVWYNLGNTYLDLSEYQKAIDSYDEALKLKTNTMYLFNKAIALDNLGMENEAKDLYLNIITDDSKFHQAHYNLACILARQKDLIASLDHLRLAINYADDEDYGKAAREDDDFLEIRHKNQFRELTADTSNI